MKNYIGSYVIAYDWSDKQRIYCKDLFKEDPIEGKASEWYIKNFNPNSYIILKRWGEKPIDNKEILYRFYHKS